MIHVTYKPEEVERTRPGVHVSVPRCRVSKKPMCPFNVIRIDRMVDRLANRQDEDFLIRGDYSAQQSSMRGILCPDYRLESNLKRLCNTPDGVSSEPRSLE